MLKNKFARFGAVFSLLCVTFGFTGCAVAPVYYSEMSAEDMQAFPSNETKLEITADILGLQNMSIVFEDKAGILYFNEKTTEIALKNKKTGETWFSNPQDRQNATDPLINAQLVVTTLNKKDTPKKWCTFTDSVASGQFKTHKLDNGIAVEYFMGERAPNVLYPAALSKERYDEIMNTMPTEKEKGYLKRLYGQFNYEKTDSVQTRDNMKTMYANIEELNIIYVLKGVLSNLEKKHLTSALEQGKYTEEMRDSDEALVGFVGGDNAKESFLITVEYRLEDGELVVAVDPAKIKATSKLKISEISILRNFGAQKPGSDAYMFLPDGSGAIISTDKFEATPWPEYNRAVYGQDLGILKSDRPSYSEQIYLPVLGGYTRQSAYLAICEKGQAQMSVIAGKSNAMENYTFAAPNFMLLPFSLVTIESSASSALNLYPREANKSPLVMRYIISENTCPSYDTLAVDYRSYLQRTDVLSPKKSVDNPVVAVNAIGAIDDIQSILGYPVTVTKPLTKVEDLALLANDLAPLSNSQIIFNYLGWEKGGIKTGYIKQAKHEPKLGTMKQFTETAKKLNERGIVYLPVTQQQYVHTNRFLDGFDPMNNSIRFITRDTGYKPQHNIANYYLDKKGLKPYIVQPQLVSKNASEFAKSIEVYGAGGINAGFMATEIYSDFNKNAQVSTEETAVYMQNALAAYKSSGKTVAAYGANQYALGYLDYALGIPASASNHPIIEKSVPFLQIVLSGSISYTLPQMNYEPNARDYVLSAIETGSGIYFDYFAADGYMVKGTGYDELYAASRESILSTALDAGAAVTEALSHFTGAYIIGHRELSPRVCATQYNNGYYVCVNYNSTDYIDVPANGYIIKKGTIN